MTDSLTIAAAAAQAGLPESTLRYWERIGLLEPVARNGSSGHRRYSEQEVTQLESLANLRAVGLSLEDMRAYLGRDRDADATAGEQRALFAAHAQRLRDEIDTLRLRLTYLDLKVAYWSALEVDDPDAAQEVADRLSPVMRDMRTTRNGRTA
jgi:DNA-binding transcriptional MerR regulator